MDIAGLVQLILLVAFIAGGVFLFSVIVLQKPARVAFGLILLICVASQPSTYGLSAPNLLGLFYVMGMNTFYFSLFQLMLLTLWGVVAFLVPKPVFADGSKPWRLMFWGYWTFGLTVLAWMLADNSPWFSNDWLMSVFWKSSYSQILWQGIFVYILYNCLTQRSDLRRLSLLMVTAITLNHVWGMFRYVALGGDPQNAYAMLEKLSVKITFWDINDSILAAFLVGYCTWWLLTKPQAERSRRLLHLGILLLAAASIVLTSRRTAQGGLIFALLCTLVCLPKGKRGIVILLMVAMIPAALVVTAQRSSSQSGSLIDRVLLDMNASKFESRKTTRNYEFERAWATLKERPIFGLGPRGQFRVIDDEGLKYHHFNFGFVHSGWGHILLKTGFFGLAVYVAMLLSLGYHVAAAWSRIPESLKALSVGAASSLFAGLPNFTMGTPVIEIRTMLVMGAMMAILMAVVRVAHTRKEEPEPSPESLPILTHEVSV